MATPEYIPPEKKKISFSWLSGLKKEDGNLNRFGIHAYITLAINLFYFISNGAVCLCGIVWCFESDVIIAVINFFGYILIGIDVLMWFTYLPYIFISLIAQIIGAIKAKKVSGIFFVNLILSAVTPFIIESAMSQCF